MLSVGCLDDPVEVSGSIDEEGKVENGSSKEDIENHKENQEPIR